MVASARSTNGGAVISSGFGCRWNPKKDSVEAFVGESWKVFCKFDFLFEHNTAANKTKLLNIKFASKKSRGEILLKQEGCEFQEKKAFTKKPASLRLNSLAYQ